MVGADTLLLSGGRGSAEIELNRIGVLEEVSSSGQADGGGSGSHERRVVQEIPGHTAVRGRLVGTGHANAWRIWE